MYTVTLSHAPNPDLDGGYWDDFTGAPCGTAKIASMDEASQICQRYIAEAGLGGSNWTGGEIRDQSGKVVANVSYNGRIWPVGGDA